MIATKADPKTKKPLDMLKVMRWIRESPLLASEKAVLFALGTRVDGDHMCYPSLERLCKDAGLKSRSHVSETVTRLTQKGYITKVKVPSPKGGFPRNHYRLRVGFVEKKGAADAVSATAATDKKNSHVSLKQKLSHPGLKLSHQKLEQDLESFVSEAKLAYSQAGDLESEKIPEKSDSEEIDFPESEKKEDPFCSEMFSKAAATSSIEIVNCYNHPPLTQKTMVGFWFAIKNFYFPDAPKALQLKPRHYKDLTLLFSKVLSPQDAFEIVQWTFENWPLLQKHPYFQASKYPTPSYILDSVDLLQQGMQVMGKGKEGAKDADHEGH